MGKEGSFNALLTSAALTAVVGSIPLFLIGKIGEIKFHEGLSISILGWILTCVVGMIPYCLWGGEFTLANALFESVSGYTTTGSSILSNVEALPKGMLFWRSSTSLIGGLGIILFVLLVLPEKRGSMSSFYRVEVSELSRMNFVIKGKRITRRIATVYFILIAAHTILLYLFGMSFFDAVCHSFSTIATSGFSTKNLNIAHYNSVAIELVILFFMLISSMHFGLIYATMTLKKTILLLPVPYGCTCVSWHSESSLSLFYLRTRISTSGESHSGTPRFKWFLSRAPPDMPRWIPPAGPSSPLYCSSISLSSVG